MTPELKILVVNGHTGKDSRTPITDLGEYNFVYGFKNHFKFAVIFLFKLFNFSTELDIADDHFADFCEGSHDLDVDLDSFLTV